MTTLQIRIDKELRNQAKKVAGALGMDLTTAIRVFLKQMVTENGLPFRPGLNPIYANKTKFKESIAPTDQQNFDQLSSFTPSRCD